MAIDFDPDSCDTIRSNRPWPGLFAMIFHNVTSSAILEKAGLQRGRVHVLIRGGPPCQPFSKSSYWVRGDSRRLDDPRSTTLHAYMRCVEDLLPEVFLLENVHGISYSGKEEGLRLLESLTLGINRRAGTKYALSWKVLSAADYGAPLESYSILSGGASRWQDVSMAASDTWSGAWGRWRSRNSALQLSGREPYVTAWDAIGNFAPPKDEDLSPKGYWADVLPSIPEGENYLWHTNRKGGLQLFGWAHSILELPTQARKEPTIVDTASAAGPSDRTVPLGQPTPER